MTRCPCTKSVCRPGTSFFYKVLSSLKQLQSHKKYCNGAGLDDITKFMDTTYNLSGDIVSQVENALCAAESFRFVVKKKNQYALLCPAATLQFTPGPCVKAKLERIQQIFNSKWCKGGKDTVRRSNRKSRRNSYSPPHFIPTKEANDPSIPKIDLKNSKSKALLIKSENLDAEDESRRQSSLKSYLKSLKLCKCGPTSLKKNLLCSSQDPSKDTVSESTPKKKSTPCSTSSRGYSKRKRRKSKLSPSRKKKRVSARAQNSPKENMCNPCATSSDESDSESSEC